MERFGRFFLPGPTEVRPAIRRAMLKPMIGHRGAAFQELFARLQDGLRFVFRTTRPVYISTSSATGLMEAGVRCAPQGRMLALVNGAFSQRFATIAKRTGREFDVYEVPAGQAHDPGELIARLDQKQFALLTVVHCETSTGAVNDIQTLARVARERGVATIVDSVTGIGGIPFEFDDWGIDFALTGSQKAMALPPGLAFAAATPEFIAGAQSAAGRGVYFDLVEHESMAEKNEAPNTPAVSLLFALDEQLKAIRAEGMEARWARHAAMRSRMARWVEETRRDTARDLRIAVPKPIRSATVTAVQLPEGVSGSAFVNAVARRGFTVGSGYRALGDSSFRIGHMGDHTVRGLGRCLAACDEALAELVR